MHANSLHSDGASLPGCQMSFGETKIKRTKHKKKKKRDNRKHPLHCHERIKTCLSNTCCVRDVCWEAVHGAMLLLGRENKSVHTEFWFE